MAHAQRRIAHVWAVALGRFRDHVHNNPYRPTMAEGPTMGEDRHDVDR